MRPYSTSRGGRRGTITVIVVAFLALLFVLGLTFVFYSIGEADQAKAQRDQASVSVSGEIGSPPDPDPLFNEALGDIIFGPPDGMPGAFNPLRGHDMARGAWGYNPADPLGATQAYNGFGRVPISDPANPANSIYPFLAAAYPGVPFDKMINVAWVPTMFNRMMFEIDNNNYRDPTGASPRVPNDPTWNYRYYAKNANYTYPDMNNMFLGAVDARSGKVLLPSYHRPYLMYDMSAVPAPREVLPDNPITGPVGGAADPNGPLPTSGNPGPQTNPWTNAWGRLLALTPRPVDHQWPPDSGQSFFPYPQKNYVQDTNPPYGPVWDGTSGHVQNLPGPEQRMDSVWLDFDLPVRRWQGKNYKPLFAFLIVDLDSRVNVNTAGNYYPLPDVNQPPPNPPIYRQYLPPQFWHSSNQGIGPNEVNLSRVMPTPIPNQILSLPPPPNPNLALWQNNDAAYISRVPLTWNGGPAPGYTYGSPMAHNRFGGLNPAYNQVGMPDRVYRTYQNEFPVPPALNMPAPGTAGHHYGQVDWDGRAGLTMLPLQVQPKWGDAPFATGRHTSMIFGPGYVGQPGNAGDPPRPSPDSRYGNGMYIPNFYDERTGHLSMYSPYLVRTQRATNLTLAPDRAFGPEEMRILNDRFYYGPNEKFVGSDLAMLAPNTLGAPRFGPTQLNPRWAITTLSSDFAQPGASPWLPAPAGGTYQLAAAPHAYPTGQPYELKPASWMLPAPDPASVTPPDHDQHYRARIAALGAVDLNRKLTDYRLYTNQPLSPDNIGNKTRAIRDRQELANDIFARLRFVTTGESGTITAAPGSPNYNALRWLAQLAVNIVDFIDNDDLITPFNWNPAVSGTTVVDRRNGWVYGFEKPRLVMNEKYTRLENHPQDMGMPVAGAQFPGAAMPYSLRCWIELHNPITPQTPSEMSLDPMGDDGTHGGYRALLEEQVSPAPGAPKIPQSAYRILVYKVPVMGAGGNPDPFQQEMQAPDNTPGLPQSMNQVKVVDFADAAKAVAPNGKTVMPNVTAAIDNASGKTFYLLGPSDDAPMGMAGVPAQLPPMGTQADLTHTELSLAVPQADVSDMQKAITWVPAFVLQRLADPYSIGGNTNKDDPTSPLNDPLNPYVTIDYLNPDMSKVSIYDRLKYWFDGMHDPNMQPDLNTTFSWGRRQPYDARIDYADQTHYRQNSTPPGAMGQIGGHTFGKHNVKTANWPAPVAAAASNIDQSPGDWTPGDDTLQFPFLPLNHLDRVVINPMELLHTVAVKPSDFTHSFFLLPEKFPSSVPMPPMPPGAVRRLAYTANWLDEPDVFLTPGMNRSTFLFRALDFLRTSPTLEGIPPGGRVPGKINLNTQYTTKEIFDAVADANPANRFTQTAPPTPPSTQSVDAAWGAFMGPNTGIRPTLGQFSMQDRPVAGLAVGVSRAGNVNGGTGLPDGTNSQDRTLGRMGGLWQRGANAEDYVVSGSAGAAEKFELLNKTFNQFTTRSNVFMVYCTIGYFEVMNDGPYNELNRPVLGAEIGAADGTILRHRFFSIVDRTNLTIEPPVPQLGPSPVAAPTAKQGLPPVYLEYQPSVMLPDASNGYQINPDPYLPPVPAAGYAGLSQVPVRVPAQSQVLGASPPYPPNKPIRLSGYYDGTLWTIWDDPLNTVNLGGLPQPVTRAILGTGATAEPVILMLPPNSFEPATGSATIIVVADNPPPPGLPPPPGANMFRYQHYRGESLRIVNPDPLATAFWSTLLNPADPIQAQILLTLQRNASVPGNPGPQAGFQYKASRYAPVVRYAEQLK